MQRSVALSMVEQESDGVREDLPQQPAGQVPDVLGPHPLYGIPLRELREDGVDALTKATQEGLPFGGTVALLAPVGREQFDAPPGHLFLRFGRMVVAVSDGEPSGGLDELRQHGKLVGIGRGYREAGDHAGPADPPNVHPEAVEGLPEQGVLTESGLPAEAPTAR